MSLYDVVAGLQRTAEMLHADCPSYLCTQRLIQSLGETVVCCQDVEDAAKGLRRNCSDRSRLAMLDTSPAVVRIADVLPVCAQLAEHASLFASCVADALLTGGNGGRPAPTIALAMAPQQLCGLAQQCCDELVRVLRSALGTQSVVVSVRCGGGASARTSLDVAAWQSSTCGGGVSQWMHLYRVVLPVESNALMWARCSSSIAAMPQPGEDLRGPPGPVLSMANDDLCQVLMTRELTHIEPVSLRSQLITRYVCDLLDINGDGHVDIADLCVVAPNTPLLRLMEADAAAHDRGRRRGTDSALRSSTSDVDDAAATATATCNRCEYLESQLLLAKREIASLKSQMASRLTRRGEGNVALSLPSAGKHVGNSPAGTPPSLFYRPLDEKQQGPAAPSTGSPSLGTTGSGSFAQFFSAGWRPNRTPQRESERFQVASHNPLPTTPPSLHRRASFDVRSLHANGGSAYTHRTGGDDDDLQPVEAMDHRSAAWSEFEATLGVMPVLQRTHDDSVIKHNDNDPPRRSSPTTLSNKMAARVRSLYDDDDDG